MKDELTTAMHSEFTVDTETETKHQVWACCRRILYDGLTVNAAAPIYGVTIEQFKMHYPEFLELSDLEDFVIFE